MAEQKKQPELFKANLFTSPTPSPGSLSFGLTNDSFNSSFSLVPALSTPAVIQNTSPTTKKDDIKTTVVSSDVAKTDATDPALKTTPISSVATPTSYSAELSTVPLDSPPPSSEALPIVGSEVTSLTATPHRPLIQPQVGPGWNDPPINNTTADGTTTDSYSIQPLAAQPDTVSLPPVAAVQPVPQQQQTPTNPYRLGTGGGSKRVTYGTGGVTSSYPPQAPPTSLPPSLPNTYTPNVNQAQVDMTVNQEVGVVSGGVVQQLRHHWFYLRPNERYWIPFSLIDSTILEHTLSTTTTTHHQVLIPTDGGRYDVDLHARTRTAIYWNEPSSQVRRCSWFYKGNNNRWYMPYTENIATRLEEEYVRAVMGGVWGGRVDVGEDEGVILHSQTSMAHYPASQFQPITHDVEYSHPRSVLRGFAEIDHIDQGEQSRIDHLVFVVHGIGEHHDLNFRCLVDCVDDFREVSQLMLKTHRFAGQAPQEGDNGGRVEYLPVHWHAALHGDSMGVDSKLQRLSLKSISRLRGFTNSTLLDILYFTSPVYLQTIVDQVSGEMNRMYELFLQRNPGYSGGVSVMGHSLGSCILFDILSHQDGSGLVENSLSEEPLPQEDIIDQPNQEKTEQEVDLEEVDMPTTLETALSYLGLDDLIHVFLKEQIDFDSLLMISNDDLKELGLTMGPRKKLSSFITSQGDKIRAAKERKAQMEAERKARERELAKQQQEEKKQSQTRLQGVKFVRGVAGTGQPHVIIPQLRFKTENMFAIGSPIGLFLIVRGVEELGPEYRLPYCKQIFNVFHPFDPVAYRLEPLLCDTPPEKPVLMPHHKGRKRFHLELYETVEQVGASMKQYVVEGMRNMWQQLNELARSHRTAEQQQMDVTKEEPDTPSIADVGQLVIEKEIGKLNGGRRLDYVLQEKPIEKLNEYLFALSSHLSYWRSEDTALFILKEVYEEMNPELIKS